MANVSTLVDTTVENMDEMGESVLRLSKKIPKPINDLTEGLYYIRSAGIGAAGVGFCATAMHPVMSKIANPMPPAVRRIIAGDCS